MLLFNVLVVFRSQIITTKIFIVLCTVSPNSIVLTNLSSLFGVKEDLISIQVCPSDIYRFYVCVLIIYSHQHRIYILTLRSNAISDYHLPEMSVLRCYLLQQLSAFSVVGQHFICYVQFTVWSFLYNAHFNKE